MHISIIRTPWRNFLSLLVSKLLFGKTERFSPDEVIPEEVKRILFVRSDMIGDMLLATPAISALKRAFPDAHIAVLTSVYNSSVLENNPDVNEVITCNNKRFFTKSPRAWLRLRRQVRNKFDLVLDPYEGFWLPNAFTVYMSRAKWRVAYSSRFFSPFYNVEVIPSKEDIYEVDRNLDLVKAIIGHCESVLSEPAAYAPGRSESKGMILNLTEEERNWAKEFLKYRVRKPFIIINPGAKREPRRWRTRNFGKLAARIIKELSANVMIMWGPGEHAMAMKVVRLAGANALLAPPTNMRQLAALISYCHVFVCANTGPFHMALAMDVPTVGIFGREDHVRWTPPDNPRLVLVKGGPIKEVAVQEVFEAVGKCLKL